MSNWLKYIFPFQTGRGLVFLLLFYILPSIQGGVGGGSALFAQEVTVLVTPVQRVLPPQAGMYVENPGRFFTIRLINNTDQTQLIHMGVQLEQHFPEQALWVSSNQASNHIPRQPITLQPNQHKTLNSVEARHLFDHFDANDFYIREGDNFNLSSGDYGLMPEGEYEVFLTAYKWDPELTSPQVLSDPTGGNARFNICYAAQPPTFLQPIQSLAFDELSALSVVKVNKNLPFFQWTQPTLQCNPALTSYDYSVRIVELQSMTPDEAMESNTQTFYEKTTTVNTLSLPTAYVNQMIGYNDSIGKVYAMQVTARNRFVDQNTLNFTLLENDGKSPILLFQFYDPNYKQPATEAEGNATGEPTDSTGNKKSGAGMGVVSATGEQDTIPYVFNQPRLTRPTFAGKTGRKVYWGDSIKAEWRRPYLDKGYGQREDTVKFSYTVALYTGNTADKRDIIFKSKPVYSEKDILDKYEHVIKWDKIKEKVKAGDYFYLRVTAKPKFLADSLHKMKADSLNFVDFALTNRFNENYQCGNEYIDIANKTPITGKPAPNKDVKIGEFYLSFNDDVKLQDDCFSGTGWIRWNPQTDNYFNMNARVAVKFDGLKVNTDYEVFEGKCMTYSRSSMKVGEYTADQFVDSLFSSDGLSDIFGQLGLPADVAEKVSNYADMGFDMAGIDGKDMATNLAQSYNLGKYYSYYRTGRQTWNDWKNGDVMDLYFPVELPKEIKSFLPKDFSVQIASMQFTPQSAQMNIIGEIALPNSDVFDGQNVLIFGAPRLCITPDRFFPEEGVLALLSNLPLKDPSSDFKMVFKAPSQPLSPEPDDGCFIRWDDGGFGGLGLEIAISIPNTNRVMDGKVKKNVPALLDVKTVIRGNDSAGDFIATGTLTPFEVKDLPGWTFHVADEIVFDHNMNENDKLMPTLDQVQKTYGDVFDPTECGSYVKTDWNAWQGAFIKNVSVGFPKFSVLGGNSEGVKVGTKDMLIDGSGVTCQVFVDSILTAETNAVGGWKFTIDHAAVNIVQNDFDNCIIKGDIGIPLFKVKPKDDKKKDSDKKKETDKKKDGDKKDDDKKAKPQESDLRYTCEIRHLTDPSKDEKYYTYHEKRNKDGSPVVDAKGNIQYEKKEHTRRSYGEESRYAYIFTTEEIGDLDLSCFVATATLKKEQTYFALEAEDNLATGDTDTRVELCIGGDLTIGSGDGASDWVKDLTKSLPMDLKIPGVHFTKLRLSNVKRSSWKSNFATIKKLQEDRDKYDEEWAKDNKPLLESEEMEIAKDCYLDLGEWSLASERKKLGPFSFNLEKFSPSYKDNKITIDIKGDIGLVEDKICVGAGIAISSKVDMSKGWQQMSLSDGDVEFKSIKAAVDFTVLKLDLELDCIKNDKEHQGDKGYKGTANIDVNGFFSVKCEGGFFEHAATDDDMKEKAAEAKEQAEKEGRTFNEQTEADGDRNYSWGYFKCVMESAAGIHADPVVINRIAGGFYFNCKPTKGGDGDKFGGTPIAQYGPIGIALGLGLNTTAGKETLNADVDLMVVYDRHYDCLSTFMFNGKLAAISGMIKADVSLVYQNDKDKAGNTTERYLCLNITTEFGIDSSHLEESITGANSKLQSIKEKLAEFQKEVDDVVAKTPIGAPTSSLDELGDENQKGKKVTAESKSSDKEFKAGQTSINIEFKVTWKEKDKEAYITPKWHLYVGEPDVAKRCTFTYLKFKSKVVSVDIGANGYLCIGNELPDGGKLPDIPEKIRKFLEGEKKEGVSMDADLAKVEKSRAKAARALLDPTNIKGGVMVGASAWGDMHLDLGLIYGGIDAMAGFDVSLIHYGATATCINSGSSMGYAGWYALGQLYAYLYADLGIHIKVGKLIDEKVSLIDAGIGAVMEMGLPSPTWLEGQLRVKMSFLSGLFKCNKKFKFSAGDHCVPFAGNALADFDMFQGVSLGSDSIYEALGKPETAISRSDANRLVFTTNPSLNSHYRLVDPSYKAYTGNDSTLDIHNSRTYVFDVEKNDDYGQPCGVEVYDLGTLPTQWLGSGRLTEGQFKAQMQKAIQSKYDDGSKQESFFTGLAKQYFDRQSTSEEASVEMKSKDINAAQKVPWPTDGMHSFLYKKGKYRLENVSIREDKGTSFHITGLNLQPGHSYMLVLTGSAYEIQNGRRQWVDYFDEADGNRYKPINWKQKKMWFFRVKSYDEDKVVGDSLKDLTPYVALAYPSVDGTNVQSKGIATTAYMDDILKPNIALNRNLQAELPESSLKWVLTACNENDTVKQERAARYASADNCVNIVADTAFIKVAQFARGTGNYDFKSETYKLQLLHSFKYEGRDSTVALVDLQLNPAPYDVKLSDGKTYTDNWMQSTNSAVTGQLLPYSEPFVGARPWERPVIDYEDYYTGKLAKKIDDDETFIDNAEKYNGQPFRLVDPYLYLAYLSKWTFIGDRAINAYSFDEVETPLGSETLIFQKGSTVMNAEFLKNDANVKPLYQVRNDFYSTWNDWRYNNDLLPEYPLPITLGSVSGPTANNQDERASSVTPINLNHQKDHSLNLANIVKGFTDAYTVADKMCRALKNKAYDLYDAFAWNWVANDYKDINDDDLDKAVKQWSDLHRGQYIEVSSGDVTAKVPYYQLPLIFGDCFGGGAKYKGKSLSRRKRTFNASIGKNDITDTENRWPSEASNLMFFRLIGTDWGFADCEPEAFLRWENYKWHDSYLYSYTSNKKMQIAWDKFDRKAALEAVKGFKARIYRVDAYDTSTGLYTVSGRKLGGGPWYKDISVGTGSSIAGDMGAMDELVDQQNVYNSTHSDQPMMQALWTADNTTLTLVYSDQLDIHETGGKYVTNSYKGDEFDAFMNQVYKEKKDVTRIVIDPSVNEAPLRSTHNWFWGCKKLTSIEGLNNINMENVTDMSGMFGNCEQLTAIDMSEIVAPKGVNTSMMFSGCSKLKTLHIDRFEPQAIERCGSMFTAVPSTLTTYYSYDLDERIKEQIPGTRKEGSNPVKAIYCTNSKSEKVLLFINTTYEFNINSTYSIKGAKQTYSNMKVLALWKADQVLKNSTGQWPWRAYNTSIQKVIIDPSFKDSPESTRSWFYEFSNLSSIEGLEHLNTSKVTDMSFMFWHDSKLTTLNVKNMNTANVTLMKEMFAGCSGLKELDVTGFDVSQVTDFAHMFSNCSSLEYIDISKFRFKNATKLKGLFYHCAALTSVSIGSQMDCCHNLTDVSYMFSGCTNLKEVYFDAFFNTDKVTTFSYMFNKCEKLERINVAGGNNATLNTTAATDLSYMFSNCYKLTRMPFSWNGQKVTTTRTMFQNCKALTELNLSILKTDKVTDMSYMFYGCKGLNLLRLDNLTETSLSATDYMFTNVPTTTTIYMLYKTWNGKGNIKTRLPKATYPNLKLLYPAQVLYVTKGNEEKLVFLSRETPYTINDVITEGVVNIVWSGMDIYKADGAPVWTDHKGVTKVIIRPSFADVTPFTLKEWFRLPNLKTIEGLQYLNTSQATSMEGMFDECNNLTSLDLSNFDTKNVTEMSAMFYGCSKLTKLDLSSFNTSKVHRMDDMFRNCRSLTSLNVSSFDLSKGPNVLDLFRGCSSLTTLDLSSFDTKYIKDFVNMFKDCEKLKELDLSSFSTEGITNTIAFSGMFQGCKSLKKLTIGAEFRTRLAYYDENNPTFGDVRDMEVIAPEKLVPLMHNEFTGALGFIDGDTGWFRDEGTPRETQDDVPQLVWTEGNNTFTFFCGPQREEGGYFGRHKVTRVWSGTDITATPVKDSKGHFDTPWTAEMSNGGATGQTVNVVFDPTFAKVRPTTTKSWFKSTKPIIQGLEHLNTSEVTTMARMFENCDLGDTDLDLSHFNTAKVTDFDRMFNGCAAGSINLSSFNTSQAEKVSYMFYNYKIPSLDLSNFNTNKVTDASYWLNSQHIKNLKVGSNFTFNALQPLGPAHWTKVTDMDILVAPASSLESVRSAITSKLKFVEGTNGRIYSEEKPVAQVIYTADDKTLTFVYKNLYTKGGKYKGKTITELWSGTSVINNQQDKAPWAENTTVKSNAQAVVFDPSFADAKPTSTKGWFNMLSKLESIKGMEHLNTSEVTTMARMFADLKMSTIDVSHFNTAKVTDMSYMFLNANLTKLDLSNFNTLNVTTMEGMFRGCQRLLTLDVSAFNTSKVTNMASMFSMCHSKELSLGHAFYTSNVTTMYSMFDDCRFSEISFYDCFVTTKVKDMSYMFANNKNLTKLDLHQFTGREVTNMQNMFGECSNLTSFDVNGISTLTSLSTSKATNMSGMFKNCTSLTSIDLSSFNTSKVTNMSWMFDGCSKLKEIKVGKGFSVSAMSKKQSSTFYGVKGVTIQLDPSLWDKRNAIFVDKLGFKKGSTANDNGWLYKYQDWTKFYDPAK